jgi:glycosyltransferase involved in cell wall biosynthesis
LFFPRRCARLIPKIGVIRVRTILIFARRENDKSLLLQMSVKLSVVIITFNEEKNIGRCLESVREVADEVVVVDSFSRDRTRGICESFGVRFVERAFEGHVEQKNFANSQATYPHILSLDADEALTEELRASVAEAKQNWRADAYWVSRLTNYCGTWVRHSGWYPDRKIRLFDRNKVRWVGQNPHDTILPDAGVQTARLQGDLLHYSYYSIKQHLDQINFFTDISSGQMQRKGKKASLLHLLLKPPFRFAYAYFFRLGLLDGFAGFCIAVLSAYAVFVKYAKLYQANKQENKIEVPV